MPETTTTAAVEKRIMLDLDRCIECKSCMAACYYGHGRMTGLSFVDIGPALLPVVCRQCSDPACVEVCPAKAMKRDARGVVARGIFMCRGCGSCVRACPFGMLSLELAGHQVAKCDLCEDRVSAGGVPRCVAACTSGALRFESAESMEKNQVLLLSGRMAGEHRYRRR